MQLTDTDIFSDNPSPRVPVVLCLDTSSSMTMFIGDEQPIQELNRGLKLFYESIMQNEMARFSAEIAIISFGNKGVQKLRDFALIDQQPDAPELRAYGMTPMSEAVELSLRLVEERKKKYRDAGIEYFQPWLVLMTDGEPDSHSRASVVGQRCQELIKQQKLVVFPIAIGDQARLSCLQDFTIPQRRPLKLQGLKFDQFFEWLSHSLEQVSSSTPGDRINLDMEGLKGWAQL